MRMRRSLASWVGAIGLLGLAPAVMTPASPLTPADRLAPASSVAVSPAPGPDLRPELVAFGHPGGTGNLLAIQPWLTPADYASGDRLFARLRGYLVASREAGWVDPKTIAVFPEYVGTWLVVEGESAAVLEAPTIAAAMQPLVLAHLGAFLWQIPGAAAADRVRYALFALKARQMATSYHTVFSGLAREFGITIVAGSILLPETRLAGNRLEVAGSGPLYNTSVVYGPSGAPLGPPVRKAYLIGDEQPFVRAGSAQALPVFETPAGRLAVLICADSWYPDCYRALARDRVDLVAVPSYASSDGSWSRTWAGYDGAPAPADVDRQDIGRLREHEAWRKYALAGRMKASGARAGVNVFLRGRLWDLGSDGQTIAVTKEEIHLGPLVDGPAVVNLWI